MKGNLILLLVAAIWGTGFVAQRSGMDSLGPFTYSGMRYLLGCISLLPLLYYFRHSAAAVRRKTVPAGIAAGVIMCVAVSMQQIGLLYTSAGKAAFITCLYIVIVPFIELLLGRRISRYTWLGALLALLGLYMLCVKEGLMMSGGDAIIFISAFLWALHILYIDHCVSGIDAITFAFTQFLTCAVLSLSVAGIWETITWEGVQAAAVPLLYGGFFPVGVAYTLQIVGQKYADPSHAAIILSMESVFGALAGYLFLNELMSLSEIGGCVLMAAGMFAAQLDGFAKKQKESADDFR